ncbi:MAG: right-handed parallel beta-helix repeat-containing protein [Chloroflexota bacterium]
MPLRMAPAARSAAVPLLAALLGLLGTAPASAAVFTVNDYHDEIDAAPGDGQCRAATGTCTLRAAVMEANALSGLDVIELPAGTYRITRDGRGEDNALTGDLDIRDDVAITGTSQLPTTIDGAGIDRVFDVLAGPTSVFFGTMTITGGDPGPATAGGGIRSTVPIEMQRVAVVHSAAARGGGIAAGAGALRITNSTVSSNRASERGGAISFEGSAWELTLTGATIAHNTSGSGGALADVSGTSHVQYQWTSARSIVAHNSPLDCSFGQYGSFTVTSLQSLQGDTSCPATSPPDVRGHIAMQQLRDNGGPTPTHMPAPGSPAIRGATFLCDNYDQRGALRPPVYGIAACDIGAAESAYLIDTTADGDDADAGDGICRTAVGTCTLRAAISESSGQFERGIVLIPPGVYTLSAPGAGEDANATGDLDLRANLELVGLGAVTILGGGIDRVIHVLPGADVYVRNVTIQGGHAVAPTDDGGGIFNQGNLTLMNVTLTGNVADDSGGAIRNNPGARLSAANVTISGNRAAIGAAIFNRFQGSTGAQAELQFVTVTGNQQTTGPGIGALYADSGAPIYVGNSIVDNPAIPACGGDVRNRGSNVQRGQQCPFGDDSSAGGVEPRLGPLVWNGGYTQTHALLAGSPAADRSSSLPATGEPLACSMFDQRGLPRLVDGYGPFGALCDAGAFEQQAPPLPPPARVAPIPGTSPTAPPPTHRTRSSPAGRPAPAPSRR